MTFDLGAGDRAAWQALNAGLAAAPAPPRATPWWRRHLRWLVLALVADVLVGVLVWRWVVDEGSTPERAVQRVAERVGAQDWSGLRAELCAPDRGRYTTEDLAQAGAAALLVLRGVEGFEATRVSHLPEVRLGPAGLPARRVEGQLVAALGPRSAAHVTVVKEPTAWKVCLSAGGYGVAALGVEVPPQQDLLAR